MSVASIEREQENAVTSRYDRASRIATEFINDQEILDTIAFAQSNRNNRELISSILERAQDCKGLTHREAAVLLECGLDDQNEKMKHREGETKQFYGTGSSFATRNFPTTV